MADSKTVIERLFEYLKAKGISPSRLEKMAGLANGYLRNSKGGLGAQKLSDILIACPDLNATWLMIGHGDMLNSGNVTGNTIVVDTNAIARKRSFGRTKADKARTSTSIVVKSTSPSENASQTITLTPLGKHNEIHTLQVELLNAYRQNNVLLSDIQELKQQLGALTLQLQSMPQPKSKSRGIRVRKKGGAKGIG